jgi:hypothetical protein
LHIVALATIAGMDLTHHQRVAEYLNRSILWQRDPFWYGDASPFWMRSFGSVAHQRPAVEELAAELLADAEFQSLRLGSWLETPEGAFYAQVVEMVMPPFYRQDAELLVSALKLAAKLQQRNQRLAGGVALGAIALVLVLGLGGSTGPRA